MGIKDDIIFASDFYGRNYKINDNNGKIEKFNIVKQSEEIVQEFGFEKKEQFVFSKEICKEQIDSIKIIRKPIKEFEKQGVKEIIIPHAEVDDWLNLIE